MGFTKIFFRPEGSRLKKQERATVQVKECRERIVPHLLPLVALRTRDPSACRALPQQPGLLITVLPGVTDDVLDIFSR